MHTRKMRELVKLNSPIFMMVAVVVFVCFFSLLAGVFHEAYAKVMSLASYLSWHNLMEIASIMVCFSVFIVSYYSFNQTRILRTMIVGCVLLTAGLLDTMHTLSFKGMPVFFIENATSNRATTFWIISRLVCAVGFLWASLVPLEKKVKASKRLFIIPSFLFVIAVFIIVTYFPDLLPRMYMEGQGITSVKIAAEYVIMLLMAGAIGAYLKDYSKTGDGLSILMCSALIFGIAAEFQFTVYKEILDSYNYTGHIFKVIMYFFILRVVFMRNVHMPYVELSAAQEELKEYARNLDRIVEHRTKQLMLTNMKLTEDLECARDIQKAMLPASMPESQTVSFSLGYFPAERLSGDFYDLFRVDDQHIGLCICDVSGHGVPAAMLTVFLKQALLAKMEEDRNSGNVSLPSTVLKNIYDSFNHSNFKDDVYLVMIYAVYNEITRKLTYSSAGLNAPPVLVKRGGAVSEVNISGFPICKFNDIVDVEYTDSFLDLNCGDKLLFYTDGLVESQDPYKVRYSTERLIRLLETNDRLNGKALSDKVINDLNSFMHGGSVEDDITFFIMEIK